MRHGVLALLAVAMTLAIGACGNSSKDNSASSAGSSSSTAATSAAKPASSGKPIEVRVVTVTPVTAGTWDPAQHAAYMAAAKANNWHLEIAQAVPYGQAAQVFKQWGSQGVKVVFSTDNGFESALLAAAKQFPKTAWVMMSALSTTNNLSNVAGYTINWCQLGYAQGAAAGLVSKSHKIGDVGAIPILPAQQTLAGQQAGAQAVAPGSTVTMKYSGDFIDAQKAQAVASGLIGNGADVILGVTQGGISPQIAARAQSQKAYYVGSYLDEQKFAPNATVSSVTIDFRHGYEQAVNGWVNDSFDNKIHITGLAEGTLKVTPFRLGFSSLDSKLQAQLEKVKSGKVKWPAGKCSNG